MKVKISDMKLTHLNNNCIMLISKFSRVLKSHDGTVVRLNDDKVVLRVFSIAAKTTNSELKLLAKRLRDEIKKHCLGDRDEEASFQTYEVVSKNSETPKLAKAS